MERWQKRERSKVGWQSAVLCVADLDGLDSVLDLEQPEW